MINVPGSAASFSTGSMSVTGVSVNNVIWNFDSATTLTLNRILFDGTILAPFAAYTGTSGDLDGQLIANTATGSTTFHNFLFSGTLPNTAAEPGTRVLLAISGLLFSIRFWKSRKAVIISAGVWTAKKRLPAGSGAPGTQTWHRPEKRPRKARRHTPHRRNIADKSRSMPVPGFLILPGNNPALLPA